MDSELLLAFTHLNRVIKERVPQNRSRQIALEHIEDASMRVYLAVDRGEDAAGNTGVIPRFHHDNVRERDSGDNRWGSSRETARGSE